MTTWIIILTLIMTTNAQYLDIQDLTYNNGYIPIKLDEIRPIETYSKIIHIINVTMYEETLRLIADNVAILKTTTTDTKTLLDTVDKNFAILKAKIANLSPQFRRKRGLVNLLGKGLKIITGTMDSEDEEHINYSLKQLYENNGLLTNTIHNLTQINNFFSDQIKNITDHINIQQIHVGKYLNQFKNIFQNKIATLEDEILFMQHIYQINNDIALLRNHIDDIGQVVFSSKLGIIPTDILTPKEMDLIIDFDSYVNIKTSVALHDGNILLIFKIPLYSQNTLSKITFEPIPDPKNKTLALETYTVLIDHNKNIYQSIFKDNLEKNLIRIENKCIQNILEFKEANCSMKNFENEDVTEILPGLLIFKNYEQNVNHNCNNNNKLQIKGTFLIKFENCNIITKNKNFTNVNLRIKDKIILPNIITKIRSNENVTINDLKLETIYLKQIKYEENLNNILYHDKKTKTISFSIDIIIILCIIILIIIYMLRPKQIFNVSSEPQANGGGVIMSPIIPLTRANII